MKRVISVVACSLLLAACGGDKAFVDLGPAGIDVGGKAEAIHGPTGTTVRFPLNGIEMFTVTCAADPFCGLDMEFGITGIHMDDGLTPNQRELQRYGITLETYGPQSFNGDDQPSFSADVPAADLVDSYQSFGSIRVAHGGTLSFSVHDPLGLLIKQEFKGYDVELRFPRCKGGTDWCD
jgi:hypothetical protein